MRGKFIVFEGGNGSGKTTQIRLFNKYLVKKGVPVISTHGFGTKFGQIIKKIYLQFENNALTPFTEALLLCSTRSQLIDKLIIPSLKNGYIVLCDRFNLSILAYYCCGLDLSVETLSFILQSATRNLRPDLTILLDIDPVIALGRIHQRDRFERLPLEFHAKVRDGFLKLVLKDNKTIIISAEGSIDQIQLKIRDIALELIKEAESLV
ncbi:MAG: dTMP kinase [Nitrospirota bacterium]